MVESVPYGTLFFFTQEDQFALVYPKVRQHLLEPNVSPLNIKSSGSGLLMKTLLKGSLIDCRFLTAAFSSGPVRYHTRYWALTRTETPLTIHPVQQLT